MKQFALLTLIFFSGFESRSQASLAAENIIDDISIGDNVYTVLRDLQKPNQWYYIPPKIRVAEKTNAQGVAEPKLTIIRYQYKDKANGQTKEGGVLTFVFTLAIPSKESDSLKAKLIKLTNNKQAMLTALPFNSCKITLLSPNNNFIEDFDTAPTPGSTFANSEMTFSIPLTVLGTDVYQALTSSTTGITLRADIKFTGILPPCGITASGNWDNVYSYFDKSTSIEAGIGWNIFSLGGKYSKQNISDTLKTKLRISINQIPCDSANTYTGDIIKRIQDEVFKRSSLDSINKFQQMKSLLADSSTTPENKIKLESLLSAWSAKIGVQRVVKNISKRKTGAINFNYNVSQRIERSARIDGAISLGSYNFTPEQLKKYIIEVNSVIGWPSAIFGLPNVNLDLGIRSMNLAISYMLPDGTRLQEARQWTVARGWRTPTNVESSLIQFNLIGINSPIADLEFDAKLGVVTDVGSNFEITKKIKAFNGEENFDAIEQLVRQFNIDGTLLDYFRITGNASDLSYVRVTVRHGTSSFNKDIKPYFVNQVVGAPPLVKIIISEDDLPFSLDFTYRLNNGQTVVKKIANESGDITLDNFEWRQ